MTVTEKKVLNIFLNNPTSYPEVYRSMFHNESYAYKVINKYIPTDTGIELEIGKDAIEKLPKEVYNQFVRDSSFELTRRFTGIHQYKVLYRLLHYLNSTTFPSNGGIHIHTNIRYLQLKYGFKIRELINYINDTNLISTLSSIFKYEGKYNKLKAADCKGNFLNIRKDFNTFEYRGIPLVSSYSELMKIIMICHYSTKMILEKSIDSNLNKLSIFNL